MNLCLEFRILWKWHVLGWWKKMILKMEILWWLHSWWCYCGVTFLLFWPIRVVYLLIGGLLSMRREGRSTHWMCWNSITCLQTQWQIKESGSVGSATSWNHLDAIIALFVSINKISPCIYICTPMYMFRGDKLHWFIGFRWAMCVEDGPSLCLGC